MTSRRAFLLGLAALYPVVARSQRAPRSEKPLRVGILTLFPAAMFRIQEKAFVDSMRELGWVEGRNIIFDRVYADNDAARLPVLAAELVSRGPHVIYAQANLPARAAFSETSKVPIVFAGVDDPVQLGVIKSLSRPGGNITGIVNMGWELSGKRMQLLKEAMPKLGRVGVLMTPYRGASEGLKLIEQAAGSNVQVIPAMVKGAKELDAAFALLAQNKVDAVLTSHVTLFLRERKRIVELAAKQRLPVMGHRSELADSGALMSYSSLLTDDIRRGAQLVDKVLKGTKPTDIPVEQPTKFALVVNMKTAKALGIAIPQSILLQAERVIE
ncbi:MAG: hypothetical protein A3F74_22135 [Betaproteobacteria bacterium RIFCSPLOWO2_12_FULL_62_58]|nr:MAG: hypothetical protein A3F74_22135 [Betaproteobacteria bacterium RIFCSPLOWO2_12_FULL_62_58]